MLAQKGTPRRRKTTGDRDKVRLTLAAKRRSGTEDEEIEIKASKQLTLRCGESSITLTAAGKIILRGKYIISRSSGVQRIKGGSVQIN
jgi:hypothetical protein